MPSLALRQNGWKHETVPGGQIAGLLGESNVRPAGEIVAAMVREAAAILTERAGLVMRDA